MKLTDEQQKSMEEALKKPENIHEVGESFEAGFHAAIEYMQPKWVIVGEDGPWPEKNVNCFVLYKDDGTYYVDIDLFQRHANKNNSFWWNVGNLDSVIAWAPIPIPQPPASLEKERTE